MAEPRLDRPVLTIDLDAVVANYRRLQREAPSAEIAGVVKADGYGLGMAEIARALAGAGCRTFFVAMLDEGVALRALLPEATISVLAGVTPGGKGVLAAHDLVPALNTPGQIALWSAHARRLERRLPASLHLDTGMCRLGLDRHEVETLDPAQLEPLELVSVMSHLACAEEPDNPLNAAQRQRFEAHCARLPAAPQSLANSSGIFLGPAYHYQLCRPGIAVYGGNPTPGRPNPMAPVVTLEAPVLQVHEVREPGTVGYGATYTVRPGSRIATLPLGYADGILRSASNRARLRIGAHRAPIAGRISMDLITVDVTDPPAEAVRPGAWVEVIGGPDGIDAFAEAAGTIAYEVLTALGRRYERRYLGAAAP